MSDETDKRTLLTKFAESAWGGPSAMLFWFTACTSPIFLAKESSKQKQSVPPQEPAVVEMVSNQFSARNSVEAIPDEVTSKWREMHPSKLSKSQAENLSDKLAVEASVKDAIEPTP